MIGAAGMDATVITEVAMASDPARCTVGADSWQHMYKLAGRKPAV